MLISSGSARDWHFGQRNVAAGFKHDAHATPDDATPDVGAADEKEDIPKASKSTYCLVLLNQSKAVVDCSARWRALLCVCPTFGAALR